MPRRALLVALAALLLAPTLASGGLGERATVGDDAAVDAALAWLASRQLPDGTFAGVGLAYVVEALAESGRDPRAWPTSERSAYGALAPWTKSSADGNWKADARVAHAVGISGLDPRAVNGHDFVAGLRAPYVGSQAYVNDDIWGILALRAAGVPADDAQVRRHVVEVLAGRAQDGGWGYTPAAAKSGTDMTAMALAALHAAGHDVRGDQQARALLDARRDAATGGHTDPSDTAPNCQSTVWAAHASRLLDGVDDARALAFVRSLQNPDGGFGKHRGDTSEAWCTAEAALLLSGGRFPLRGFAPGVATVAPAHALDAARLEVTGPFTRAVWNLSGATVDGRVATHAFPSAGAHPWRVLAEGDGTRWRGDGVAQVATARPHVTLRASSIDALRHVPVALDVDARDPDGHVVLVEADWGGGATTRAPLPLEPHAYTLPGNHTVRIRAQDDAGAWSDEARVVVRVANRAPTLAPLPARVVADRVTPLTLDLAASDPDDDAVAVSWQLGASLGHGAPLLTFDALGEHALNVTARDPFGAMAVARVVIDVVNVPPTLANLSLPLRPMEGERFEVSIDAADADGPAPEVEWSIGGQPARGPRAMASLPAGAHEVAVTARDADGAERTLRATLVVAAGEAAGDAQFPARAPPRIENVTIEPTDGALRVAFDVAPADAEVLLLRDGADAVAVRAGDLVPLRGAREAAGTLEARADGLVASVAWGPVRVALPPLAPPAFERTPASVVVGESVVLALAPHPHAREFAFDLGDGSERAWGASRSVDHAWARPGSYEVRALARDGERVAGAVLVVTVSAAPAPPAMDETETPRLEGSALAADGPRDADVTAAAPPRPSAQRQVPGMAALALVVLAAACASAWPPRTRGP